VNYWRENLFYHPATAHSRPLVACSACLLGEPVRYDGGHKLQQGFERWLAPWLQLQAVCPEVGIGLGIPRPTLMVIDANEAATRVVEVENPDRDVTEALTNYADSYLARIGDFWPLTGWIFKARSPSCGVGSTPVNPDTPQQYAGSGAFAGQLARRAPWLALYEEEDLLEERHCARLLLGSFICRDILWQAGDGSSAALLAHYGEVLEYVTESRGDSRLDTWNAVRGGLAALGEDSLRRLIDSYRAAEPG
jgi:uncharacterized protein YbbK (DUF523 family)